MLKRPFLSSLIATVFAVLAFFVPPAFANANSDVNTVAGGFTGWSLPPMVCGGSSISPVIITNYTSVPQTGSITINPGLSLEAAVFTSATQASDSPYGVCEGRSPGPGNPQAFTSNFTVNPGETSVYYLGMGGTDYNLINTSHNIAIGGLPNGSPNPSWYDFILNLTADEGFSSLQLSYKNTGGTGSNNNQNGFNVVAIENGVATTTILSPYSSKNAGGNVVWEANQPIGLAWLP